MTTPKIIIFLSPPQIIVLPVPNVSAFPMPQNVITPNSQLTVQEPINQSPPSNITISNVNVNNSVIDEQNNSFSAFSIDNINIDNVNDQENFHGIPIILVDSDDESSVFEISITDNDAAEYEEGYAADISEDYAYSA